MSLVFGISLAIFTLCLAMAIGEYNIQKAIRDEKMRADRKARQKEMILKLVEENFRLARYKL